MERILLTMLFIYSISPVLAASVSEGGFNASVPPPPPREQDSGVKGLDNEHLQTHVFQLDGQRKNAWVTLQGNIIKKTAPDTYIFRDKTGSVSVTLTDDKWGGQTVTPEDLVSISGRLSNQANKPEIKVEHVRVQ